MSLETPTTISFEEIVKGRDSTVRITPDNLIYAVDLVGAVTGKDANQSAEVLRRLSDEIFPESKMLSRKLSTHNGTYTKLLTFKHAIELIMVLPGKIAKETRAQFADILHRFMACDETLMDDMKANEQHKSPVTELAKSTLHMEEDPVRKRKREDLEFSKMEAEVIKIRAEAIALEQSNHMMRVKINQDIAEQYTSLTKNTDIDERARLIFKDNLMNLATQGRLSITNGSMPPEVKPISISMVAADMGYKKKSSELSVIGKEVRKLYVERYNKEPSKHDQLCDGRVTPVNSYTEADRDMIESVLRAKFGK